MLCSIIMPLYNKAPYVEAAIHSVLSQGHDDFELIVVDDGSTDDSAVMVARFDDRRLRLIRQKNSGVSAARNRGIASATGEIVCFLDADDCYQPQYLETIVGLATQYPHLNACATGFRRFSTDRPNDIQTDVFAGKTEIIVDYFEQRRRRGALLCMGSIAVRRHTLNQMQPCFPPGEAMGEDLDLIFRVAERSAIAYCPAALANYRVGVVNSLTALHRPRALLPCWTRLSMRARAHAIPSALRRSAMKLVAHEQMMLARAALSEGRRQDALASLRASAVGIPPLSWWTTAALAMTGSRDAAQRWNRFRSQSAED